jgi:uncharacterized membrane protein YfhO
VRWLERSPQSARLWVDVPRDSLLVISDSWYPSWRATQDGAQVPLLKADGGLQAVPVRAGSHEIDLRFDNGLFNAALAAALAGCALVLGLGWLDAGSSARGGR